MGIISNIKGAIKRAKAQHKLSQSKWAYEEKLKNMQTENARLEAKKKYINEQERMRQLSSETSSVKRTIRKGVSGAKQIKKSFQSNNPFKGRGIEVGSSGPQFGPNQVVEVRRKGKKKRETVIQQSGPNYSGRGLEFGSSRGPFG